MINETWSPRLAALIAGFGLLVMAILAGWSNGVAIQGQIVAGDAVATAENLVNNASLFRIGATGLIMVAILDVMVAWGLFVVFRDKHHSISMLGAWSRVVYAAWFAAIINKLFDALRAASIDPEAAMFHLESFETGWQAGLIIFGLHLGILGWLMWRTGIFARIISVLLYLGALGYSLDGFSTLLTPTGPWGLVMFTFIGELVLIAWLLLYGGKSEVTQSAHVN
jgi:hypothetical protein